MLQLSLEASCSFSVLMSFPQPSLQLQSAPSFCDILKSHEEKYSDFNIFLLIVKFNYCILLIQCIGYRNGTSHKLDCSSCLHQVLAHRARDHESGAVGKCVRNGLKIHFWLEQKLQLPSLIYQESSCFICSSWNYSLPHFLCLRRYDDDDNGMDSLYRLSYSQKLLQIGIEDWTKIIF